MKKLLLVCGFIIASGVFLMAQDIDAMVKTAVDSLALRVTSPIDTSIGEIYLEGTVTPTGLSRYLANRIKNYAPDTGKFNLLPLAHSNIPVRPGQNGIIKGSFQQTGGMVNITLQLVGDPSGQIIESRSFSIPESYLKENGIDVLPANVRTLEEVIEQERLFIPPASQQTASALQIEVWPDSDTGTYFAGDKLSIYLLANKDCYARVDYIDADGNWRLLYPDRNNRFNFIRANQQQTLPRTPVELISALGMERIWVRVSTDPFTISESDYYDVKAATRDTVAASRAASGRAGETAEAFFSITKLPATFYDETWSYQSDSIAEDIEDIRVYVRQQGGNFPDNDIEGSFSTIETTGVYRVTGDTITFNQRNTSNQLFASVTRSTRGFDFHFKKPGDMKTARNNAEEAVLKEKDGKFGGDEREGWFSAYVIKDVKIVGNISTHVEGTIAGRYYVTERVKVFIDEKPDKAPEFFIILEVKKFFKVE